MIVSAASALLISDIHLTPSMPLTAQRFFDFCEKDAPKVEAVFILGDLFEYWVGDDTVLHSPFHQEVKRALASLSTKVKIYYLHGNRDFLLGSDFLKKTGMTLMNDPAKIAVDGTEYVVSHGDSLCTADVAYQVFRKWTRKPWIQKLFLSLPAHWRRSIANHLRSKSTAQYQKAERLTPVTNRMKTNVTLPAIAAALVTQSGDRLIHGHTHLPAHHQEQYAEQSWQRWVLSDWDLDHPETAKPRASALLIDAQGVRYLDLIRH
ncbi:UDP-2,3-diacylglucosamine hydrolase [Polynucleobacter meluiroseus]|uniref:UDP-2,3-diacylglucosamine hydrolase n=1 Tax=Polynucleobacter meluiroseus TaxID=1938814 RepID=A0A240E177_9BURK|nr:UDP-2,3-diacylglucosamine diphosphatase [Polynucleobacter meluiroseus]SNX28664.1 UDP-2,3-diacylglucosamine hydrolase [Polynucleobacter meluiroseus]